MTNACEYNKPLSGLRRATDRRRTVGSSEDEISSASPPPARGPATTCGRTYPTEASYVNNLSLINNKIQRYRNPRFTKMHIMNIIFINFEFILNRLKIYIFNNSLFLYIMYQCTKSVKRVHVNTVIDLV